MPDIDWSEGCHLCVDVAQGDCAASVDGYCIGGTEDGMCHG